MDYKKKNIDDEINFLSGYVNLIKDVNFCDLDTRFLYERIERINSEYEIYLNNISFKGIGYKMNRENFYKLMNYAKLNLDKLFESFEHQKGEITIVELSNDVKEEIMEFIFLQKPEYSFKYESKYDNILPFLFGFIESILRNYENHIMEEINDFERINTIPQTTPDKDFEPNPLIKEQKTHFLFLHELGIIDFIKDKYNDRLNVENDNRLSALIAQTMGISDDKGIENIRTYIRDLRNKGDFINETVMKKVNRLMSFHGLK